ncbi:hypothetical protein FHR91_001815 [Erythrobacter lutimaris]|nr:hypothetical protein [Alteriqipengyuania lutimaris]
MARTLARTITSDPLNTARTLVVSGCAIALIVAERFVPIF